MNKNLIKKLMILSSFFVASIQNSLHADKHVVIVGSGIIGAVEALFAYQDAVENNIDLKISILEKDADLQSTAMNIAPSLTCDELASVVPTGSELVAKLKIPFYEQGGILVTDVAGLNNQVADNFIESVQNYSKNPEASSLLTQDILELGKMSMDLWQSLYDHADAELKEIFHKSNFNACRHPKNVDQKTVHDGYRIDLMYNIANAQTKAFNMMHDYQKLGYNQCCILTPQEVLHLDPSLSDFCYAYSEKDQNDQLVWKNTAVALWRPGGCLFAKSFIPLLYEYLAKKMGTFVDDFGKKQNRFQIYFSSKVVGVHLQSDYQNKVKIVALCLDNQQFFTVHDEEVEYIFAPGEAVGTLKSLGFCEPDYAGFAGASLKLLIDIPKQEFEKVASLNHCMEVHQPGVVLAWQSRILDNKIFIAVAGTKSFYADQKPKIDQAFAKNRNLLQLNIINNVLPEYVSWALGRDTKGQILTQDDMDYLENAGIAQRWVGVRAVAYDGFPTLGYLYTQDGVQVVNARCTTHMGSGGVSFAPAAVLVSKSAFQASLQSDFIQKMLQLGSSLRTS